MTTISSHVISIASGVRSAMRYEPGIKLNLEYADISQILAVMFCVMWNGLVDASAIYSYLDERGCRLDQAGVHFLLSAFSGDPSHGFLWSREKDGTFRPSMGA